MNLERGFRTSKQKFNFRKCCIWHSNFLGKAEALQAFTLVSARFVIIQLPEDFSRPSSSSILDTRLILETASMMKATEQTTAFAAGTQKSTKGSKTISSPMSGAQNFCPTAWPRKKSPEIEISTGKKSCAKATVREKMGPAPRAMTATQTCSSVRVRLFPLKRM